jgi:hypothetical protein
VEFNCVQSRKSIVTVVANGCGPMVSPRTGRRDGSPPHEQHRGLRAIGPTRALVLLSDDLLV